MAQVPYFVPTSGSGASNAQDFQPLTRNPQQIAPYTQQQTGAGLQNSVGLDGMYNNNIEISVPSGGDSQVLSDQVQAKTSNHWPAFLVVVVLVTVTVVVLYRVLRKPAHKS